MIEHNATDHRLNRPNAKGETPLGLAAMMGNTKAVRWLVENGANPAIASNGELPVQVAERWRHYETFEFLLKNGRYPKDELQQLFKETRRKQTISLLGKYGVKVRGKSDFGMCCFSCG